jgi:hypothetical protein
MPVLREGIMNRGLTNEGKFMLDHASQGGNEIYLDLWYPEVEPDSIRFLVLGLMHVRASDNIRISYDFERDGWKIEQPIKSGEEYGWKESAFLPAWQYEEE